MSHEYDQLERINAVYNPENDLIPDVIRVTHTDKVLIDCIIELYQEVSELKEPKKEDTLKMHPYWCKCDDTDIHKVIFGGDDECPCKVSKHHYHCHACGCIVQIG